MTSNANNVTLFDRNHAAQIFIPNNFALSPKYGWLFHVSFDLNSEVSRTTNDQILKMGFLVKSSSLPKFSVETKTMNAYNRVDIVQTKVKYDPLTIKFHDDNLDVIRNFWYDYYSYYYRDADWNDNIYSAPTKYSERQNKVWGYSPRQYPASSPGTQQYINAIKIYSLHNKRFAEYTIINPIITAFRHGEHAQGGESGTLENEMTVQYQAVKYRYGDVSEDTVTGFATLSYDKRESTMGTTQVKDHTVHDLAEGATGVAGIVNNLKNINGAAIAGMALGAGINGLVGAAMSGKLGTAFDGIKAGASDLVSGIKGKLGFGLPNDAAGAGPDIQTQIDDLTAQIADQENVIQALNDDLDNTNALKDDIENNISNLEYALDNDPNLTDEDRSAIEQQILDETANLDVVLSDIQDLQDQIDMHTSQLLEKYAKLSELQDAQNPSGNSEEEGGPGADSTTQTFDDGSSITTNPDGSTTTIDSDGNIYTTPQQNAVDNPNASSNQSNTYPDP